MPMVYLGIGSNVANRERNIRKAVAMLEKHPQIIIRKISSIIETEAVSKVSQPKYLNGAIAIETGLLPRELLSFTEEIEQNLGRESKGTNDPRTIDLDILFYGDEIICDDALIIPHPMLHEREFVIIPLNEIAPDLVHPILQETISSLFRRRIGY